MASRTPASVAALLLGAALGSRAPAQTVKIASPSGLTADVDAASGRYEIREAGPGWTWGGVVVGPLTSLSQDRGVDRAGAYREVRFDWGASPRMEGAIRLYAGRPAALFTVSSPDPAEGRDFRFPDFDTFPKGLRHLSFAERAFAPPRFDLERNGTPWLFFDGRGRAAILSPADDFLVAGMAGDGVRSVASGLNPQVGRLPAGFSHATLLAFGPGINAAWEAWGRALADLLGRRRPANDADAGLRYFGYWTDNGAYYYYNYDRELGYAGTLARLVAHYRERRIPIRYLQLDSWWYEKSFTGVDGSRGRTKNPRLPAGEWNRYGGLLAYKADPAVFPRGLAGFERRVGLPLITHNRWIDPASPYRARYAISGLGAVDPRFWDDLIGGIARDGVVCYEQDWLSEIYPHSPAFPSVPGTAAAFAGGMARAAARNGLSLQYCMALPRFFLQGARYDDLTTIRTSEDRMRRSRWNDFLFTSRLASALGIWPWTDVFMSTERDNLLLATLSGGMVGVGDRIGAEDRDNLMRSMRADGVLVKPDAALVPSDASYQAFAAGTGAPMVAWTRTDHGPIRTVYVFAYRREGGASGGAFTPASFGLGGTVEVYDAFSGGAREARAGDPFRFRLGAGGTGYFVIAPVSPDGIAFFGDAGEFVAAGRKRIASIESAPGCTTVGVTFAAGEGPVRLFGYARSAPVVRALEGAAGPVAYSPATGRFEVAVVPGPRVRSEPPGGDPVQEGRYEILSAAPPPVRTGSGT